MAKITVQFFSLPDEISIFLMDWIREFDLFFVTMIFFPEYEASSYRGMDIMTVKVTPQIKRICLGLSPPVMNVSSPYEFLLKNPNWLVLDIGEKKDNELYESVLGAIVEDIYVLNIWKRIVKDLKKKTYSGLWCFRPNTGEKSFYKNYRYTKLVAQNVKAGLKLIPIGVGNLCQIDEP